MVLTKSELALITIAICWILFLLFGFNWVT